MRKTIILFLIVVIQCFVNAETGGENLVNNGDIQSNGSWKYIDARRQDIDTEPDNKFIQLNYSSKFKYDKHSKNKAGNKDKRWTEASQRLHLKPNSTYKITFKASGSFATKPANNKKSKTGRVGLVKRSDATSGLVSLINVKSQNASNGWKEFTGQFKTGKIVKKERLIFYSNGNAPFRIDDVVVIKIN